MKRPLTPEEKKLWERVTQKDKPLRAQDVKIERDEEVKKRKIHVKQNNPHIPISSHLSIPKGGVYANIDRNTAERFRKGEYPIDATLDLHGLTYDKAKAALFRFIASRYERGDRCLLVITGKGQNSSPWKGEDQGGGQNVANPHPNLPPFRGKGYGILRDSLPHWLAESDLGSVILAFDLAKQKHGGSGAYYILLRRRRGK